MTALPELDVVRMNTPKQVRVNVQLAQLAILAHLLVPSPNHAMCLIAHLFLLLTLVEQLSTMTLTRKYFKML